MKQKRIGLVLSQVPGYSETFFVNKISGLQNAGFEIVLFVDQMAEDSGWTLCPVVGNPIRKYSRWERILGFFALTFQIFFIRPVQSMRFIKLNKKDGMPLAYNLKQLFLNQHIMGASLDFVHFGFGMLAVGRENLAEAMHAKMGVSFRGFDLYLSPLKHPNCYSVLFTKKISYHVLASDMRQSLMEYGIPQERIAIITPAIDTTFFRQESISKSIESPLQILTVARLHWKKGLEYTLEALAVLKKKGVDFHYTIVGEGDQYERLVFAVYQLGLMEQVSFVGKLTPQEVKEAYTKSQIYLQYSVQEGFCNAVLEAQAMRLICVVSNAEGLEENVLDGETGYIIPKRSPELLANCILNITKTPRETLEQIKLRARKRIEESFNLSRQQQLFVDFFKNS